MTENQQAPSRSVYCEDAITWLQNSSVLPSASLVASLPDLSEFPKYSLEQWKQWFTSTAALILSKVPETGVAIFYQSDVKLDGLWIDKGYLVQKAAEQEGAELLWHKVVCRAQPGQATFGRTGYSHLLCFSKELRLELDASTADVLPEMGEKTWERGMGLNACWAIGNFIKEQTTCTTIVNPFCGHGSMLAVANALGLSAIGIERSAKRAEIARRISVDLERKSWINVDCLIPINHR